ncbi:MAG: hypothetical protein J6D03_10695 [Clostridia bacterium]|nr:hypothetical protein [Clostridia bacterium]
MARYIIKIWETKDEREQGLSDIIESNLSDIQNAIEKAKKLVKSQNYNALEVQDTKQKITYYSHTPEEEKSFEDKIENAKIQEKINKYAKLVYNNELQDNGEDVSGLVSKVVEHLKDIKNYFKTNKSELSQEEIDYIIKETDELIEELEQNYDNEDYVSLFTHPMSDSYCINTEFKDILDDLLDYYESKIETMEFGKVNIKDVVDYYFDNKGIKNLEEYGADRDGEAMPTISSMYEDILENLKINYENIFSDDVSAGKYTTIIEFDDNHKIQVDTKSRYSAKDIYDNVQSIKNLYKDYLYEKKIERIEKIKKIDLKEIMANHYSFNNFGKIADPNEYKTINKKSLFSTMYEKVLKVIDIDVAFVTIDELNKNRYKTTVMFPNGHSDYYYSNDLCSKETAIKNIENMRNSYIKMEQEIKQNEQDMEME